MAERRAESQKPKRKRRMTRNKGTSTLRFMASGQRHDHGAEVALRHFIVATS
jgi:hypothetical protein